MRYLFKLLTPIFILLLVSLSLLLLKERNIFDTRGLVHIDPMPKTWELIRDKKYADADSYLSYFMQFDYVKNNPKAVELSNALKEKRDSYEYKKEKFIQGVIEGKSDEDIGKMSAIASDFLVIGDIRDLIIEGNNYVNDKKVDKVVVALSTLGLVATISTVYTFGTTSTAKSSLSILKYGTKVNKIPNWLNKAIIKEAKVSKETKSLNNIQKILEPIYTLYQRLGLKQTLNLLKETKNLDELRGVVKLSKRFGKNSSPLIQLIGTKSIKEINSLSKSNIQPKTILYASSYGDKGLVALKRLGEAKFLLRTSKTVYKGNFDSIFEKLLKYIPTSILFAITFLGLFYYIYKFSTLLTTKYLKSQSSLGIG
jgi:hypothetical protein